MTGTSPCLATNPRLTNPALRPQAGPQQPLVRLQILTQPPDRNTHHGDRQSKNKVREGRQRLGILGTAGGLTHQCRTPLAAGTTATQTRRRTNLKQRHAAARSTAASGEGDATVISANLLLTQQGGTFAAPAAWGESFYPDFTSHCTAFSLERYADRLAAFATQQGWRFPPSLRE